MPQRRRKKWDGYQTFLATMFTFLALFIFGQVVNVWTNEGAHLALSQTVCHSNMMQLGVALEQYAQDSDNQLPPLVQPSVKQTWRETIYPFVKSVGVYRCPDATDMDGMDGPPTPKNLPLSYAANRTVWGKTGNEYSVILLVDVRGDDGPYWDMTSRVFAPSSGWQLYTHKPHNPFYEHPAGTINCLFTDGHVKAMKPMATLMPVNLWTRGNKPFTGQELTNAKAILQHAQDE